MKQNPMKIFPSTLELSKQQSNIAQLIVMTYYLEEIVNSEKI
jgi:hypothetical protein